MYNSAGELVKRVADNLGVYDQPSGLDAEQPGFVPDAGGLGWVLVVGPRLPIAWDGSNSRGQWVQSGTYTLVLSSTDPFGHVTTFTSQVAVLRAPASVQVDIYNSAGELVRHFDSQANDKLAGSELTLSSTSLAAGSGPAGSERDLTIHYGAGQDDQAVWDGRDDEGQLVQSGSYIVKVLREEPGSGPSVLSETVTVIDTVSDPLSGAMAGPDPVGPGTAAVVIQLAGPSAAAVTARVYDQAGELVDSVNAPQGSRRLEWNVAARNYGPGAYLIELETLDAQGRLERKILKVALER